MERLIDRVSDSRVAGLFRLALKERQREKFLAGRRNLVADADLRFFLGVILNASRRRDVMTLIRERDRGGSPPSQAAAWLRKLSTITLKLQTAEGNWQPNVLGLPDFTDELELACAKMLSSEDHRPSAGVAAALERMRSLPALACLFVD